ncbi:hypothetical protein V5799_019894 [Amblyomma americanum]|uniref:Uncharacterized protein n=1 Tax=Amblyomma americanum TaxID=6943 RepID=A0AAQ4EVF9_AMBAM
MLLLHELTRAEDRQHQCVIDNTGIRGSPRGGPALHEVETGYDPVAWQQRSSKEHSLIVPDLVTADQPDSLVVNASAARVDAREDRQYPSVIDNTDIRGSPSGGPALHEVETGYDPVAWQQRSSKEHSLIVPDLVTADQPDSLVVNASAAQVDAREDRQYPSVIDNTGIRGSPPGGPALHEVETGYHPVAWQQRSSEEHSLIVPDLVTADQPDSLVVIASAARVDARRRPAAPHLSSITPASGDRRRGGPALHEVETGYHPQDQQDSLVVNAFAARVDEREDRQHPSVIDNTGIRGSPPGGPELHEVETGYDPVAWQQRSSKEHSLIVPDLVTADQQDSFAVDASAARVDGREDRQHPSVIDNTGIRGSPPGGPELHEVETGYDPVAWQQRSSEEHSLIVPDFVTADQQDSPVVNASAARIDGRKDRQQPSVIDNTGIWGSPPVGPELHEVETGYDPVAWQQRSSKERSLIVPDLVTADHQDSLVVNASAARIDGREDRQQPSVIDNTGIRGSPPVGPELHEVETGYDPINRIAWSSMLLLHALTGEKTGSTHLSIDNTGIRGSPPGGPELHEVETGYDPVAWQQWSSKERSLIVPDLVTADHQDSLVVNASAARIDDREDRQQPSVIDNTGIRGSPPGGPELHESRDRIRSGRLAAAEQQRTQFDRS